MKLSLLFVFLLCPGLSEMQGYLARLSKLMKCTTGKHFAQFIIYGCHCGAGGYGQTVDAVDRCCFEHDCCYDWLKLKNCNPKSTNVEVYCSNGNPSCENAVGYSSYALCINRICRCEVNFAKCLKTAEFNALNGWRLNLFGCKRNRTPSCPSSF
ncbi:basic phospholipase A2 4-like [Protopterus annectens]|uniref:basic phospholipase A2 4-like n=1 Tax=Protopterus annectens TaxID=7888 RepID=UPI001CF9D57A|nr:basic phospholipase A2 4-like [Protopterus annectens]